MPDGRVRVGEICVEHGGAAALVVRVADVDFEHAVVLLVLQVLAEALEQDGYAGGDAVIIYIE